MSEFSPSLNLMASMASFQLISQGSPPPIHPVMPQTCYYCYYEMTLISDGLVRYLKVISYFYANLSHDKFILNAHKAIHFFLLKA